MKVSKVGRSRKAVCEVDKKKGGGGSSRCKKGFERENEDSACVVGLVDAGIAEG